MAERTDFDVLSRTPITVTLGERAYLIKPKPYFQGREFRLKCGELFADIGDLAGTFAAITDGTGKINVSLPKVLNGLRAILFEKLDAAIDLIYLYDPGLKEDRQYIGEHADDEQLIEAFFKIAKLVYRPFLHFIQGNFEIVKKSIAEMGETSPQS